MSLSFRTFQETGIFYQDLWSKAQLEENLLSADKQTTIYRSTEIRYKISD